MRSEDQKRIAAHYGALCGLRAEPDSDSDESTEAKPSPNQEPAASTMSPPTEAVPRPRPESLTLPFENRERESHLVSEDELDRIIRQGEMNHSSPPLPSGIDRSAPAGSLRRSMSTARNTRMSMMSQRTRPASADFSRMVANRAGQPDQSQGTQSALPRDPTLTALPRAPTKNDLMVYPAEADTPAKGRSLGYTSSLRKNLATSNSDRVHGKENDDHAGQKTPQKKGHKRQFSAADMVDSVKKRLKHRNQHDAEYEQARAAVSSPLGGSPVASTRSRYATNRQETDSDSHSSPRNSSQSIDLSRTQTNTKEPPNSLKKSLLKRTWSKTKHAAKLSISISSPLAGSKLKISDPLATPTSTSPLTHGDATGRDIPTPAPSTMTTGTNGTSSTQYYASAEPSPQTDQRAFTPTPTPSNGSGSGPLQQQPSDFEFITGPPPRRGVLTRLGAPPARKELNSVVARQQSRIVDLTLQNNVLVSQIELLRGGVQGMRVDRHGGGNGTDNLHVRTTTTDDAQIPNSSRARLQQTDMPPPPPPPPPPQRPTRTEAFQRVFGGERPLSQEEMQGLNGGTTRRGPQQNCQSFDPEGWRRIMGVRREREVERMDIDGDIEMDVDGSGGDQIGMEIEMDRDDKRKTWMTCDS
ncbi:hypothetical protein PMZ80_009245 [Knufia obscura]|uniref:Uncharacterized protein n=1 Tax=Knufia obscura TaxID=1635080 RepID=A0ABR0RCC8_9EURO|nr:hypothetical protein PMZ80_009245 [Knufia obscura]